METIEIKQNGKYNVREYDEAVVDIYSKEVEDLTNEISEIDAQIATKKKSFDYFRLTALVDGTIIRFNQHESSFGTKWTYNYAYPNEDGLPSEWLDYQYGKEINLNKGECIFAKVDWTGAVISGGVAIFTVKQGQVNMGGNTSQLARGLTNMMNGYATYTNRTDYNNTSFTFTAKSDYERLSVDSFISGENFNACKIFADRINIYNSVIYYSKFNDLYFYCDDIQCTGSDNGATDFKAGTSMGRVHFKSSLSQETRDELARVGFQTYGRSYIEILFDLE